MVLLGIAGGAFLGTFSSSLIHSIFGYYAVWLYVILVILFCVAGGFLAFKR